MRDVSGLRWREEWDIPGPTRVCAATGQPLPPGSEYYAVLYEQQGRWVRRDYAPEAFPGVSEGEGAVAHWRGRLPLAQQPSHGVQLDPQACLALLEQAEPVDRAGERTTALRYVAALYLWRRRRLQLRRAERDNRDGRTHYHFLDRRSGRCYRVADPQLTPEQLDALQEELIRLGS